MSIDFDNTILDASIRLIIEKLRRIRDTLTDQVENGRLTPNLQYAVRVVESRIREMQRVFLIKTRPEGDLLRVRAEKEMALRTRDMGILKRWGLKNHSIGRLDCPGCEYTLGEAGEATPRKTILAHVCVYCNQGVMHSRVVESNDEAAQAIDEWENQAQGTASASGIDVEAMLYACEACKAFKLRPQNPQLGDWYWTFDK